MRLELPDLDRGSTVPLAEQIARHYQSAISMGRLRTGDRLPPIRVVAERSGVTRGTVQEAYRRLSDHGLVTGTVGRGTTVIGSGTGDREASPLSPFAEAALREIQDAPQAPQVPSGRGTVANFADLPPAGELFPLEEVRAAFDRALQEQGGELLGYGHPAGLPELRTALAERRHEADAAAAPSDILVTAGAQQGIDLVLRTFTSPGDAVAVPLPTYQQLFALLKANGVNLVPVPCTARGIDLRELRRALAMGSVRMLYLMPTFHNPTGRTLDLAQRHALMDAVAETRVLVLEDEYEQQLRFKGQPMPSLRSLDPRGLTVTVLTSSKGLFPGLRVGWLQADAQLLGPMAAVKRCMDLETSPLLQAALLELIRSGALDRYLDGLREVLASRHAAARAALTDAMPEGCTWSEPDGGFALWLELPGDGHGERLAELAAARGVRVTPGRVFDPLGRPSRGVRLSLSRTEEAGIAAGIRVLGACCREILANHSTSQPRLFL